MSVEIDLGDKGLGEIAGALLAHIEQRRAKTAIDVKTLEAKFPTIDRYQITRALKRLASEGHGRFVLGRHGRQSRFIPAQTPTTHSQAIEAVDQAPEAGISNLSEEALHAFVLRKDPLFRVTLPSDLTSTEADRLAAWVKTLPTD